MPPTATRPPRAAARRFSDLIVRAFDDLTEHEARMVHDTVQAIERNPALELEAEELRHALARVLSAVRLGNRDAGSRRRPTRVPSGYRDNPSGASWAIERRAASAPTGTSCHVTYT